MEDLLPADISPKKGKWTSEEDDILRQAVAELGENHWKLISLRIGNRSPIQCLHRWSKTLKPGLVKGPWSVDEDELVVLWVKMNGTSRWAECAAGIGGRSGKQCRERWMNILDPSLKKGDWSEHEEEVLLRLHQRKGGKWTEIAKFLPGRSENCIKNHYYSTLRKNKKYIPITTQSNAENLKPNVYPQVLKLLQQLTQMEEMLKTTYTHLETLEKFIDEEEEMEVSLQSEQESTCMSEIFQED